MASVVVSFLMSTYYSVIIAYAIYYFFAAFRPEIPWLDCSHRFVNFTNVERKMLKKTNVCFLFATFDLDGQHQTAGPQNDSKKICQDQ